MLRFILAFMIALLAGEATAGCNATLISVSDWSARQLDERNVEMSVSVLSHAEKQIRMLYAIAYFDDVFDVPIGSVSIGPDAVIAAGGTYPELSTWTPHNFGRLLQMRKEDVKTATCVKAVLYEDGTKETF
ncbi:hypothetical protein [Sinorhizobium meliloti]|uniref:hypothetical protein n=1 Tax=Rhizobium meliloti TaxID=382 RepID=UPI000FD97B25|nr:hypothetical protein [Sinorhizobium meliloti]RVL61017.1 hypothetical protein CN137_17530 [Sinorhizobium meliloti]